MKAWNKQQTAVNTAKKKRKQTSTWRHESINSLAAQVAGARRLWKFVCETCREICIGKCAFTKLLHAVERNYQNFSFFHYAAGYFMHDESNISDVVANHEQDYYYHDVGGKVVGNSSRKVNFAEIFCNYFISLMFSNFWKSCSFKGIKRRKIV